MIKGLISVLALLAIVSLLSYVGWLFLIARPFREMQGAADSAQAFISQWRAFALL